MMFAAEAHAQECTDENIGKVATTTDQDFLARLGAKCEERIRDMEKAVAPHKEELGRLNKAIVAFQERIKSIEADVFKKTGQIADGEKQLTGLFDVTSRKIHEFYIRSFTANTIALFFSSSNVGSAMRTIGYQQAALNEDKKVIAKTASKVKDLEDKKNALEAEKSTLAALKADTDKRAGAVQKLVSEATAYESKVQRYIAAVTARQQEFLAQKLAGLNIPRSALSLRACVDDRSIDPGFSPRFALFTFGVPNRIGLNQWGAKGRAGAGQGYDQILRAYYSFDGYQNFDTGIRITVDGYGTYALEDYMKRIYEVPNDWPIESLRAQAIAARSYVLAYTNKGSSSICATEQCQVFQSNAKSGAWEQAVNDTAGKAMVMGGNPIKAWFSSTHGGFVFASGDLEGWSATSWTKRIIDASSAINGFSDLFANAYDRGSPWFYCDWGARAQYNKTAWMKPEELADIANVILLARRDSSARLHLYQTDKPNPEGAETWDAGRVRSELGSDAISSVNDVTIDWDRTNGITTQIRISGDGKSYSFDGKEFKNFFNLRAPANIQIVGPLFNVEKR